MKKSSPFIEPECSLPCWQKPVTGLISRPHIRHSLLMISEKIVKFCKIYNTIDKDRPTTGHGGPEGSTLSLTSTLYGVGGQHHAMAALPLGKNPVPIIQEAGCAPGLVWTGAENLAPTVIRSPDRPVRSESLYRLSYHGPHKAVG